MTELLKALNRFTRRELTEDEVYIFSVILCDNEVDRDYEKFSLKALQNMKELFLGKTGIFDHNTKENSQTARIFNTELVTDTTRKTADGEDYTYLKADAYMMKTSKNDDLIKEIDGGIKKEVSVSCLTKSKVCSVCGCELSKNMCAHKKGKVYNKKMCFNILSDVCDAYEWSFVSVPAQKNAGVTKSFISNDTKDSIRQKFLEGISREMAVEKGIDVSAYKINTEVK